jgi:ATP-dependent Zn protease
MKYSFLRCFFSITLFLSVCPSIFTNPEKSQELEVSEQELTAQHEIFQTLMSEAKEQALTLGFCIQQLCQTISAGKLKLTLEEKQRLVQDLEQIAQLINLISNKILVQNSQDALCKAIILNGTLIDYLTKVISTDLKKLKLESLHALLTKRCDMQIDDEVIFNMALSNQSKLQDLVYYADHVGLTWYNHIYRGLKRNNGYSVAKGVGLTAGAVAIFALVACSLDQPSKNPWWNWLVGAYPHRCKEDPGYFVMQRDPATLKPIKVDQGNGLMKNNWTELDVLDMNLTQRAIVAIQNLQTVGLVATSALLTINYKEILAWMFKDTSDWAKEKVVKKAKDLDQKLQGSAKKSSDKQDEEKIPLSEMVGCEDLKQLALNIANFMKHPERYERAQIEEHRGILLSGPPQCGKTFFAKVLRSLIDEELGDEQHVKFIDAKKYYDAGYDIEYIFWYASFYAPCIIFIDELDMLGTRREKDPFNTSQLLTCMQGIDMKSKQIFVIAATNRPEQIDPALLVDGRFGKKIHIDYPRYQDRLAYLIRELDKRCIHLEPEFIDSMAQETEGCSFNTLKRVITEAIILSSIETRPVNKADFEKTLDIEVRHMQANQTLSERERRIIATYQAGKAVARHVLKTTQQVVKVTINTVIKDIKLSEAGLVIDSSGEKPSENDKLMKNKSEQRIKLGEVFTKSTANHSELLGNQEQDKECLVLCAGNGALQLFYGDPFNQCNKHDRAEAMHLIYNMISLGEKPDEKLRIQACTLKEQMDQKILGILSEHKDLIEKIADILVKQSTIDRYEWKSLVE